MDGAKQRGEFHISHDASLHTILSSFRTHVILSVLISSTGTRQLNNGGKRLVLPIKPSVPLLCRSIYDFRSTIPNISLFKSKRVFWPPIIQLSLTIARQSTQMFLEASEEGLASVRPVLTCVDKALHRLTSDFHVLVLK